MLEQVIEMLLDGEDVSRSLRLEDNRILSHNQEIGRRAGPRQWSILAEAPAGRNRKGISEHIELVVQAAQFLNKKVVRVN